MDSLRSGDERINRVEAEKGKNKNERLHWSWLSWKCIVPNERWIWNQDDKGCMLLVFIHIPLSRGNDIAKYDQSVHSSVQDTAVDNSTTIDSLHQSQAVQDWSFHKGVDLFIGNACSSLLPVSAMLSYLCARGMENGPLCKFEGGRVLTRNCYVADTVFWLGLLLQWLPRELKTASSRTYEEGRAWCTHRLQSYLCIWDRKQVRTANIITRPVGKEGACASLSDWNF